MTISFRELSTKFLARHKLHSSERTHEYYDGHIKRFLAHLGEKADDPAVNLKPHEVEDWADSNPKWSANYRLGGIQSIISIYHFGVRGGYIEKNHIATVHKPTKEARKTYMKPEDYNQILGCIKEGDSFKDFLMFVWITGARPQEARAIEHRHVNLEKGYVLFPKEESKGKRRARRILLNTAAVEILKRNMEKHPAGHILRNSRGEPWTKYAICARFQDISKRLGRRTVCYEARHGFFTRKLKEGVGLIDLAEIGGHTNGNMIATVYQHVGDDVDRLRTMLD